MSDSNTKSFWLHMLKEGGRWKTSEAADFLCTDLSNARGLLNSMAEARSVKRFEPEAGSRANSFGVTADCCVPRGVSLADLMAVGILKEAA